ncbi:MAG: hypothetical protein R3B90_17955 [Planctomycetaceae bacterium]
MPAAKLLSPAPHHAATVDSNESPLSNPVAPPRIQLKEVADSSDCPLLADGFESFEALLNDYLASLTPRQHARMVGLDHLLDWLIERADSRAALLADILEGSPIACAALDQRLRHLHFQHLAAGNATLLGQLDLGCSLTLFSNPITICSLTRIVDEHANDEPDLIVCFPVGNTTCLARLSTSLAALLSHIQQAGSLTLDQLLLRQPSAPLDELLASLRELTTAGLLALSA